MRLRMVVADYSADIGSTIQKASRSFYTKIKQSNDKTERNGNDC